MEVGRGEGMVEGEGGAGTFKSKTLPSCNLFFPFFSSGRRTSSREGRPLNDNRMTAGEGRRSQEEESGEREGERVEEKRKRKEKREKISDIRISRIEKRTTQVKLRR